MKYLLILVVLMSCSKPKTDNATLVENKKWYVYKEVRGGETFKYSRQYWLEAKNGNFMDYDKYPGTYEIKKDTFRIYFLNYGYEVYYIDHVNRNNLVLRQEDSKGVTYRKLYFEE